MSANSTSANTSRNPPAWDRAWNALYRLQRRFRRRRINEVACAFELSNRTTVLDVGGTPAIWQLLAEGGIRPRVTLLNIHPQAKGPMLSGMSYVQGTGLDLPYERGDFDVVYSNSVIEHVGDLGAQARFAGEVRRVGGAYYVQTPNFFFPIEPHLLAVGVHWLPRVAQRGVARYGTGWGLLKKPTREQVASFLSGTRLLTPGELFALFPDAKLWRERVLGLTKSVAAVRL